MLMKNYSFQDLMLFGMFILICTSNTGQPVLGVFL